jgi:hypothetical protein
VLPTFRRPGTTHLLVGYLGSELVAPEVVRERVKVERR